MLRSLSLFSAGKTQTLWYLSEMAPCVSRPQSRVLSLNKNVWPVLSVPARSLPFLTIFWAPILCLSQSPTFHSFTLLETPPNSCCDLSWDWYIYIYIAAARFQILPIQFILKCCSLISYPPWLTQFHSTLQRWRCAPASKTYQYLTMPYICVEPLLRWRSDCWCCSI